jgi:hypothetical protein
MRRLEKRIKELTQANQRLEEEVSHHQKDIEIVDLKEVLNGLPEFSPDELMDEQCRNCEQNKRVCLIGGMESLKTNYDQITSNNNCSLIYHAGGDTDVTNLVSRSDVIFCSIDKNSHNACKCVKNACKLRKKPCYFLFSSSVTTFRKALSDYLEGRCDNSSGMWTYVHWSDEVKVEG